MGGALNVAVNKEAYILSDRSTWESFKNKKEHTIVVENEPLLFNFYGVIPLNPKKCPDVKLDKVKLFVDWITSEKTKSLIAKFKVNNKQLFSRKMKMAMTKSWPNIHQYLCFNYLMVFNK